MISANDVFFSNNILLKIKNFMRRFDYDKSNVKYKKKGNRRIKNQLCFFIRRLKENNLIKT